MPPESKAMPDDDAVVTMSTLTQLLDQQKEFYKDMLQQQQENFKSFIQIIMNGNTKRLDGVIRDVQELKTSLQFTQGIMEDMKKGYIDIDVKIKSFESSITKSKQEMDDLFNKLDYIDNQSRRSNLLIDGIAEEKGETASGLEIKIQQVLAENLGLDGTKIEIERAHRMGQFQEGRKQRKIVVKFLRFKDRQHILFSAKKLKSTNIYINEDFSDVVQQRRRELLPKLIAARKKGERASLR
ncbi:uncharacterized protein LOC124389821 isoform X1 [Silurus meridionalis]|uniref:uncharacterized protein LOC124389821 isoform X1 n=1 Tax=Silurus meridionalis TaxID=175797 RepID=UPI001EEBC2B5|nr:uncharacterized protein LOC124389821 isoform X1 [Silurus meridionalis]